VPLNAIEAAAVAGNLLYITTAYTNCTNYFTAQITTAYTKYYVIHKLLHYTQINTQHTLLHNTHDTTVTTLTYHVSKCE